MPRTRKDLLLLCNSFPFGSGETFLANEFPYLHASFDRIVIVARTNELKPSKYVPDDVKVLRLSPTSTLLRKLFLPFLLLKNIFTLSKLIRSEKGAIQKIFGSRTTSRQRSVFIHDAVKAIEIMSFVKRKALPFLQKDTVIYSYWQNAAALSGVLIKKNNPTYKCISRTHGADLYMYRNKDQYLSFRKYISENIDCLFFIAKDGKKYQEELLSNEYRSFFISQLGTDKKEEVLPKNRTNEKMVVSCSNIVPLKRLHLIVNALSMISSIEIKWIHFGGGMLASELKDLAGKMLGPMDNINFELKGNTPNDEIHTFYAENEIDLFINVSEFEGVPVSIMEAMSYGIPALATDVGGTSELVDSTTGVLVKKDVSIEELAQSITEVLSGDKYKDLGLGSNARRKILNEYTASTNYKLFIDQIQQ